MTDRPQHPAEPLRLDLLVVCLLALAATIEAQVRYLPQPLGTIIAALLVLVLPGYALAASLWPPDGLRSQFRWIASVSAAIAVSALGGLILNYVGPGITRDSWAVYLFAVTIGTAVIAELRWPRTPRPMRLRYVVGVGNLSYLVLAGAVVVAGLLLNSSSAHRQLARTPGFTALSMLEPSNAGSHSSRLQIVVQSHMRNREHLQVRVCADRRHIGLFNVMLAPAEQVTEVVVPPFSRRPHTFTVTLRAAGSERVYRWVRLLAASRSAAAPPLASPAAC